MRHLFCLFLAILLFLSPLSLSACAEDGSLTLLQQAEEQLHKELGAFEITAMQREAAKTNQAGYPVLDAGRGNPNWINTQSRYAFTRFMNFALSECERTFHQGTMAGHAQAEGTVRVSLANLNEEDYVALAGRLFELLDEYYAEFDQAAALPDAA